MADAHTKPTHEYHLVDPSPWPIIGSIFAFCTAVGLIMSMKALQLGGVKLGPVLLGVGILGLLYTLASWWFDVVHEAETGYHTRVVQISLRYGMILFISSEVMFFVAWFWAFFDASLFTNETIQAGRVAFTGGLWPPKGTEVLDPLRLPLMNTFVLVTSSFAVNVAHDELRENNRQGFQNFLLVGIVLGVLFVITQAYEYIHAPFNFKNTIYGATFFMATGFHGAHVIIGVIFLTVCLARAWAGQFTPQHHIGFQFAAWYWHFVDVVWLFLFSCIYIWGSWGASIEGAAGG